MPEGAVRDPLAVAAIALVVGVVLVVTIVYGVLRLY